MTAEKSNCHKFISAKTKHDFQAAKQLIIEYANSLGCSPCLKNIERELAAFPKPFAPPNGELILANIDHIPMGVIGIRKISGDACEMARLYVKPPFRSMGIGKLLAQKGIEAGAALGCRTIRLYTLPTMTRALAMYRALGFTEIPPYSEHPIAGAVYMQHTA